MNSILILSVLWVAAWPSDVCVRIGLQNSEYLECADGTGHGEIESHWCTVELRQSSLKHKVDFWVFVGCCYYVREYWDFYEPDEFGNIPDCQEIESITCYPAHGKQFLAKDREEAITKLVELYRDWKNDKQSKAEEVAPR